jgi:hypothetical protein
MVMKAYGIDVVTKGIGENVGRLREVYAVGAETPEEALEIFAGKVGTDSEQQVQLVGEIEKGFPGVNAVGDIKRVMNILLRSA